MKTRDADPVATTLESLAPTTESFLTPVVEPETKIQDEIISSVALPASVSTDEPAVSVSDVDHSSVAVDDLPLFVEFQDVVAEPLPVEVAEIAHEVEDPSVDLRIVAEPLIVSIPTEAPAVFVALSEPVDVPLVDVPISATTVSPAVPIFIASLLPLEPVETPEAIPEKVENGPMSEAPIYSPVQSPFVYRQNSPIKSELSSHFPSRPFGSLPKPRELGFPPVSNTHENVLRDVNWQAKLGRAYRSS